MSGSQKPNDYGQQFKTEIEHALQSGDFSGLNQLVADTVSSAVNGVTDQVTRNASRSFYKSDPNDPDKYYDAQPGSYKETTMYREQTKEAASTKKSDANMGNAFGSDRKGQPQRSKYDYRTPQTAAGYRKQESFASAQASNAVNAQKALQRKEMALLKKNGKISGTLMQVFGGVGIGMCGITSFVFLIMYMVLTDVPLLAIAIIFFFLSAGSFALLGSGNTIKNRLEKAQRYFALCKDSGYMNIAQLAEKTGLKEKQIIKDLRKLIANGTFPQGHLDQDEKCFMLTDKTYEEYKRVELQRHQMQNDAIEQKLKQEALEKAKAEEEARLTEEQKALRHMVEEGQSYIHQIRQKNEAIPGEVISQKLYRMEELLKEIFANLEQMPEQMPKMQRLMHYYLPTTLKLVSAYEQFDHMSVQGEEIVNAKNEIENTIDTINDAYGELLNKLFADSAMDVTTDAQVLKTMLAKEGLVDDNPLEK